MTMEELANVKGRGWEDIDVRVSFQSSYLRKRMKADSNHSTEQWYWRLSGEEAASKMVICTRPSRTWDAIGLLYKRDLRRCRVHLAR
jgi:hypothetical protein